MITYVILLDIFLFFRLIKLLIDTSLMTTALKKEMEVHQIPNPTLKKYQYIKGLF